MSKYARVWLGIASILLFGALPILVYLMLHGGMGGSDITELQSLNAAERSALMASLFNIKPLYMLLCVALLLVLWDRNSPPAQFLFWGFAALLLGELICGATFAAFRRELIVSEHIHSYGMLLEYSFIVRALIDLLDRRTQLEAVRSRPIFAFAALTGMIATFLPQSVTTTPDGYQADLFGFNYIYARLEFNQWVEASFLPMASLAFFALTFFTTLKSKQGGSLPPAKIFLSAGAGLLMFSVLRLTLGVLFAQQLVWFEFSEEMIQLMVISTIAFSIWHLKREWVEERLENIGFPQKKTND